ncbi:MAG TPA: hypothetical protein VHD69_02220 [Candidatus Paceibacterota bacterium]|nr:hypothetical protein [Candidatus Paceibacterota bacterium]
MKKNATAYIGIAIAGAMAAFSYLYLYPSTPDALTEQNARIYSSSQFGISFLYPRAYTLDERDVGPTAPLHRVIAFRSQDAAPTPVNGEGQPGITFEFIENEPVEMDAETFIRDKPASNWNIATSAMTPKIYDGISGIEYSWSGLYEGRSFVVARRGFIYVFSVTRFDPTDIGPVNFGRIMSTLKLAE